MLRIYRTCGVVWLVWCLGALLGCFYFIFPAVGYGLWCGGGGGGGGCVGRLDCLVAFFVFFPIVDFGGGGGGGSGCGWWWRWLWLVLNFVVDVFIIVLTSCLYYFNQIAKNIDSLMLGIL